MRRIVAIMPAGPERRKRSEAAGYMTAKLPTLSATIQVANACQMCDVLTEQPVQQCCDPCRPEQVASFSAAGRAKMAELRAVCKDPAVGGEVAKRRATKLKQRMAEQGAMGGRARDGGR